MSRAWHWKFGTQNENTEVLADNVTSEYNLTSLSSSLDWFKVLERWTVATIPMKAIIVGCKSCSFGEENKKWRMLFYKICVFRIKLCNFGIRPQRVAQRNVTLRKWVLQCFISIPVVRHENVTQSFIMASDTKSFIILYSWDPYHISNLSASRWRRSDYLVR